MGLSLQQKKILIKLSDLQPHKLSEFKYLYANCNLYRALKEMCDKKYIQKVGGFYMITQEGKDIVALYKLLKLFMFTD